MKLAGASFWAIVPASLFLSTCSKEEPRQLTTLELRQQALDRIADKCGMPRAVWKLQDEGSVTVQPDAGAPYEKVDCLLFEFNKAKLPLTLGFVGNEAYVDNEQ